MLGHIAQSIGSALPGSPALNPLVSQFIFTPGRASVVVPQGAAFAFLEALGYGGSGLNGGGGAGTDGIFPVVPGQIISSFIPLRNSNDGVDVTVSLAGSVVLTAAPGGPNRTTGSGKYPGSTTIGSGAPGKGGGRLAGEPPPDGSSNPPYPAGYGAGQASGFGGQGTAVATFFTDRDAAVAFANSLYNGAWVP